VLQVSAIDGLLANHESYAAAFDQKDLPANPALQLAVVACMDARMDVFRILGLRPGEAQVIRNAGGLITEDVMRSLVVSQWVSKTKEILLLRHTDCGMTKFDEEQLAKRVADHAGSQLGYALKAIADPEEDLRRALDTLRGAKELLHRDAIRGFVYQVDTGRLVEVG
jgi:carbonic anhydrase